MPRSAIALACPRLAIKCSGARIQPTRRPLHTSGLSDPMTTIESAPSIAAIGAGTGKSLSDKSADAYNSTTTAVLELARAAMRARSSAPTTVPVGF